MTTENNKIIAEFMGLKIVGGYLQKYVDNNTEPKQYWEGKPKTFEHQICGWQITHHESKIQYHSDWNWIMEVVEKIKFKTDCASFNFEDWQSLINAIEICLLNLNIQDTYNACLEFIKWYNEQK